MARTPSVELPRLAAKAARHIVATAGPRAVTYRAVAAEAAISASSLVNRFGSLDDLLDHVALRAFVELTDAVFDPGGRPLTDIGDPGASLDEALARYRRWALANPHVHRLMFAAPAVGRTPSAPTRRAAAELLALFEVAGRDPALGRGRFAEVHGEVQLELSGLAFPPPTTTT